jgi:hypothetical protein
MRPPPEYHWRNEDAAKRMADAIELHQRVLTKDELLAGRYIAVRLADGGSDGVAYESRSAAVEHNRNNPSRCGYFRIPFERWGPKTCDVLLWYVRSAYDNGVREDPAHALIIPLSTEDLVGQIERTYRR